MKQNKEKDTDLDFHINIKEMANLFNTTKATLRYYDSVGLISLDRNTENDYREFNRLSVVQTTDVLMLRHLGISIKEIQQILAMPVSNAVLKLEDISRQVNEHIRDLARINVELQQNMKLMQKYLSLKEFDYREREAPDFKYIIPWNLLTRESISQFLKHPYTTSYSVIIDQNDTSCFREGLCVSHCDEGIEPIWRTSDSSMHFIEFLMTTKNAYPNQNDLDKHLYNLHQKGYHTGSIIAVYLTSDYEETKNEKMDYYQAWIEIFQ